MKIAVVGAGAWGKNIVNTLHELGSLGAIVDPSETVRASFADKAPGFDSLEACINQVDAVAIATPGHTHFELAKQALRAGKDVFIEKPMVLSTGDAREICQIGEEKDLVVMVGHLLIYHPAIRFIKEQIESGRIGKLSSLHQERLNLGRARRFESVLWSIGVHDIAVLNYLMGHAPIKVTMDGQSVLQPGIEDDAYVHLGYPNNVHAHLHCSWLWPYTRRTLTVVGTEAMLVYDELKQTVTLHKKSIDANLANVNDGEEAIYEGTGKPLTLELQHFIDCSKGRQTPDSDGRSAVDVLEVIERCEEKGAAQALVSEAVI